MNNIELAFLEQFPNGLQDENWILLGKKHNMKTIHQIYENEFSAKNMKKLIKDKKYKKICELATEIVQKATIISVFEKIAFKNYIANEPIHEPFAKFLYDLLYNFSEENFDNMVNILEAYKGQKNANPCKWPVITAFIALRYPNEHVFVKPTTVKANAKILKMDIEYKSKPNFNTYTKVKDMVINFRESSTICKSENLMIVQAILFSVSSGM